MSTVINPIAAFAKVRAEADKIRLTAINGISDKIVSDIFANAEQIAGQTILTKHSNKTDFNSKIDDILTSRWLGYPIMVILLGIIFWLTITGANIPSKMIANILFAFQDQLTKWFQMAGAPEWLHGILVLGLYRTLAWVVSVMLPPMAIFFPLFTLLEDLGYLPRVAFNLDHLFKKSKACGKQCLTMCMGFGCNAAGIVSCRIIDSPRERLIAILTNNFVPCNGRFPTLIAISTIFISGSIASSMQTALNSVVITGLVMIGIAVTFLASRFLSQTLLKGEASSLVLELPPYRKPQFGAVIYRSIIDRTIFVLRRAIVMAAPAGAITWVLGNVYIGNLSIIGHLAYWLNPLAQAIGLDGFILLAFILGLPANEIVLPVLIMSYLSTGYLLDFDNVGELQKLLISYGWTWLTAVNTMLFSLLHWPCSTTLLTIFKETGNKKWTFIAFAMPTLIAFIVCFVITQFARIFGLV
ncbi:MAG: ferrous iron transporter B [Desulfitobacterium hafniense]|nr:ferrous iron transporter B [Desulfitobacterium hafniense]